MTKKHKSDGNDPRTGKAPAHEPAERTGTGAAVDRSDSAAKDPVGDQDAQSALARLEAENVELKDRLLRALAEVENVRRRADRDINDMRQYAVAKFAGDMLGVADNMERAIASVPDEARKIDAAVKTLILGVELTEKGMLQALEKHGVKKLVPVGERFDPNFHEALFELPDLSVPAGTITKVVEPGYTIGSRPLRPAKVGIATGAPPVGMPLPGNQE
ncbi:nucleotide exchange factor GrpE [Mesorhizobium sp. B2-4-12]|uniref:nucleotide exchange factor GrpE n=1 Tax=unclassified Mesorhizobium TaxID=325217 RepID=UPI001129D8D6|nr:MULTISPECIES: nucleotide exchange factor GrpE [unclassified Mesorhizobium]TPK82579.1 nucleotide exchange factor GrpE [Mesorhizobium sp. B2-4-17]TPK95561.1 nucleotide exchange factor GrpE [Mesorhizobium sp. B2-4-12]